MRAAGNDTHYTWALVRDPEREPESTDIRYVSVTTVLKTVLNGSYTPASKWGFKLGVRSAFPDIPDEEFELLLKVAGEGEHSPDNVRNAAAERGTRVHDYFEVLAKGGVDEWVPDRTLLQTGVPIGHYERQAPPAPTDDYERSVQLWWDAEMPGWEVVAAESTLFSTARKFAGTCDLIRKTTHAEWVNQPAPFNTTYEVIDLKTHSGSARYDDRLQVAAYELAAREMGLIPEEADCDHRVVLAREDGKKAGQSVKYTDPAEFLKVLDVYNAMKGVK